MMRQARLALWALGLALSSGGCWSGTREGGGAEGGSEAVDMGTAAPEDGGVLAATQGVCTHWHACWERPMPQGNDLKGLAMAGPGDLWAVGEAGTILHLENGAWVGYPSGTDQDIHAAWAAGPGDVWVVGDGGTVLRYSGSGFTRIESRTTTSLRGIWGAGGEIYAVGEGGTVLRWEGNFFVRKDLPAPYQGRTLHGVWGSGPRQFYVVGEGGLALRHDGWSWPQLQGGGSQDLLAVWGTGEDVYAVGAGGAIQHLRGDTWQVLESPTRGDLWAVWGTPTGDLLVAGAGGVLLRRAGGSWAEDALGRGIRAFGGAGGGIVAVGERGEIFYARRDRGEASFLPVSQQTGDATPLYGAWGESEGAIWAAGPQGALLRQDGVGGWREEPVPIAGGLKALWGSGPRDIWAVGDAILHYDGAGWTQAAQPEGFLHAVWGSGPRDVWAVGTRHEVWHHDGRSWVRVALPAGLATGGTLAGVWGSGPRDVWAVGQDGEVLHHDGAWARSEVPAEARQSYLGAVWASAPEDAWAVGTGGAVLRRSQGRWGLMPVHAQVNRAPGEHFHAVWGRHRDEVWIAGEGGALLRFDGQGFSSLPAATRKPLHGIFAPPGGPLRFFGGHGAILRYRG